MALTRLRAQLSPKHATRWFACRSGTVPLAQSVNSFCARRLHSAGGKLRNVDLPPVEVPPLTTSRKTSILDSRGYSYFVGLCAAGMLGYVYWRQRARMLAEDLQAELRRTISTLRSSRAKLSSELAPAVVPLTRGTATVVCFGDESDATAPTIVCVAEPGEDCTYWAAVVDASKKLNPRARFLLVKLNHPPARKRSLLLRCSDIEDVLRGAGVKGPVVLVSERTGVWPCLQVAGSPGHGGIAVVALQPQVYEFPPALGWWWDALYADLAPDHQPLQPIRPVEYEALERPNKRMVTRSSDAADEKVPSFLRNPVAAVKARRKSISYEWAWTPVLSAMEKQFLAGSAALLKQRHVEVVETYACDLPTKAMWDYGQADKLAAFWSDGADAARLCARECEAGPHDQSDEQKGPGNVVSIALQQPERAATAIQRALDSFPQPE